MAAPKTRQRILDTSLAMFNLQGEPNVTTNHIADELEISPGNLYYHFRNKDDIIEQLFQRYEERMDSALIAPEGRLPNLEDIWLQLHLVFECIWEYRSYIVNTGRIRAVSGNAPGYKLHLHGCETPVPVARKYSQIVTGR